MSRLDDVIYQAEHALLEAEDRMVAHRRRFAATTALNAHILALFDAHLSIAENGIRTLQHVKQVQEREWQRGPRLAYAALSATRPSLKRRTVAPPLRIIPHRDNPGFLSP
jgi:hypothetical protein